MKIPVFVSRPTSLNADQQSWLAMIETELDRLDLEPRTLGSNAYPTKLPLQEVTALARHCSGGVVLGFEQLRVNDGIWKPGTADIPVDPGTPLPTPWNHLESGILFGLGLPLLVFKEEKVRGGIFDHGVTDVFVHDLPPLASAGAQGFRDVFTKWQADVRSHYYRL